MRNRLSLMLLALVGAAVLALAGVAALGAAGNAKPSVPPTVLACAKCHSMEKEVSQWAGSSHADLSCLECHVDFETDWVREKLIAHTEATAAETASKQSIELKADLSRCESCHQPQMEHLKQDLFPPLLGTDGKGKAGADAGKPMAVRVLHDQHLSGAANLECVTCHLSDVHGPAAGTQERRDEEHQLCMDCHTQRGVQLAVQGDASCTGCHLDLSAVTPQDHKNPVMWKQTHGKASQTQACGDCHLSSSAGSHGRLANPTSFKATPGDSCLACHSGVPMPHPESFLSRHGQEALAAKTGTCEACHADGASSSGSAAVTAPAEEPRFCSECHAKPMPHPSDYLATHGSAALQAPATCEACHSRKNPVNPGAEHASQTYCATCHDSYQHPAGWTAAHGAQVAESCAVCHSTAEEGGLNACVTCHDAYQHPQGWVAGHGAQVTTSCATCHTTMEEQGSKNTCSACHSMETEDGSWHEPMWFVKHARQVEADGEESCLRCHAEVQPSCSKCHSER